MTDSATDILTRNIATTRAVLQTVDRHGPQMQAACAMILDALLGGRKLLCCGNGGSACDSAHFTGEIAGRYLLERPGFPAIDLTADHSILTALINDYPPVEVFARQVRAQGSEGDVLAVFTTSGNSENVLLALDAAAAAGMKTIAFLGKGGGRCAGKADIEFIIESNITARVQEAHLLLYHTICEVLDPALAEARRA